jgi:hypothetical protein
MNPTRHKHLRAVWASVGCAVLVAPAAAAATELRLSGGASAAGTEWPGDVAGWTSLKLGVRFVDLVGVFAQGRLGYALVDDRILSLISVGAELHGRIGPTRPYVLLAALHQHEETRQLVYDDPVASVFGIGDGIRHRAGGELGLGIEIPFYRKDPVEAFVGVDASAKIFPDDLGPMLYAGAGLSIGVNHAL